MVLPLAECNSDSFSGRCLSSLAECEPPKAVAERRLVQLLSAGGVASQLTPAVRSRAELLYCGLRHVSSQFREIQGRQIAISEHVTA